MQLSIYTLGTLGFAIDNVPIHNFASDKARGLLAYLAVESGRPHSRESLAGLFWAEYPENRARSNLSQTLYSLRQVIGDRDTSLPFLAVSRQSIEFNKVCDLWVDVKKLSTISTIENEPCGAELESCVSLYRGHFLAGFSIPDSPAFEEWAVLQRERFQRRIHDILHQLIDIYKNQGAYEKALHFAWQQLELDPWREDCHRQVMRLLAMTGQRTAALTQFDYCKTILWEELNVSPEDETINLREVIRTGKYKVDIVKTHLTHSSKQLAPMHNIPTQLTPFVGRKSELHDIRSLLRDPGLSFSDTAGIRWHWKDAFSSTSCMALNIRI